MNKTKFDILVENILEITEGRKPKTYNKLVIDFDKLESDINELSDNNPFKKIYLFTLNSLKEYNKDQYFTNEEMLDEPKTLPEWEEAIINTYSGHALSSVEKRRFAERFFNFVKDPDRQYFSEYVEKVSPEKSVESVEQNIYNFIQQTDDESASVEEVVQHINRYGHDSDEVKNIIQKMVKDGQILDTNGTLTVLKDPSLDDIEPSDTELNQSSDVDDLEAFRDETGSDEDPDSGKISDDIAKELGIDPEDPFGDKEFESDNESSDL